MGGGTIVAHSLETKRNKQKFQAGIFFFIIYDPFIFDNSFSKI